MSKEPGNGSGGAGGVGTAGDYLRFAKMLANGGVLDGQRVLSRTIVRLMTSDHLGSRVSFAATPGGAVLGASTYTFGLGFAVRPSDGIAPVPGSAGDFNWGGYAGTTFWVDPKEQLVGVFMVQSGAPCASTIAASSGSWSIKRSRTELPTAPAGLPRAGLGADLLGMGAQARGSEGVEGVHVDYAPRSWLPMRDSCLDREWYVWAIAQW